MKHTSSLAPLLPARLVTAVALLAAPLIGQSESFIGAGDANNDNFGWTADGGADIDGDNDLVVGNPIAFIGPLASGSAALFTYEGAVGQNYCQTLPHSGGVTAAIAATGSASIASNNLILVASQLPGVKPVLLLYGGGQVQVPAGNGTLCVGAGMQGTFRLQVVTSDANGCASLAVDLQDPAFAGGMLVPCGQWNVQGWFRDPVVGMGFNFTDGLSVTFQQ